MRAKTTDLCLFALKNLNQNWFLSMFKNSITFYLSLFRSHFARCVNLLYEKLHRKIAGIQIFVQHCICEYSSLSHSLDLAI